LTPLLWQCTSLHWSMHMFIACGATHMSKAHRGCKPRKAQAYLKQILKSSSQDKGWPSSY
jgi:hypothetical protein